MANGGSPETAVVGNEGLIGIALFMGVGTVPNPAVRQRAGHAHRMKGRVLKQELTRFGGRRHGTLHPLLRATPWPC